MDEIAIMEKDRIKITNPHFHEDKFLKKIIFLAGRLP